MATCCYRGLLRTNGRVSPSSYRLHTLVIVHPGENIGMIHTAGGKRVGSPVNLGFIILNPEALNLVLRFFSPCGLVVLFPFSMDLLEFTCKGQSFPLKRNRHGCGDKVYFAHIDLNELTQARAIVGWAKRPRGRLLESQPHLPECPM